MPASARVLAAGTASAVLLLGYGILAVMAFGLAACVYLLPMAIAVRRSHPNAIAIAVVNLLLGWTLVGYVVALAWSFTALEPKT